jgi:hypothetical protein
MGKDSILYTFMLNISHNIELLMTPAVRTPNSTTNILRVRFAYF